MSRTLRPTLYFTLPIALCAPLALTACEDNSSFVIPPDGDPVIVDPPADPPKEGAVFTSSNPPPPISGGTLIALKDGVTAVAADPDRDRVWVVDTAKLSLRGSIALEAGDEPGRSVEDGAGRVWVALRRGGAVVAIDVAALKVTARVPVCAEPRGVAYDPASDRLHVACAGGELVSLAASTGAEVRRLRLDRDLRDVLLDGKGLRVSRFRSAELLSIDAAGGVTQRVKPPAFTAFDLNPFEAAIAWRTLALPGGGVATLHQRDLASAVPNVANAYYSDPCATIVKTAVTVADPSKPQSPAAGGLEIALAVDMAVGPDGQSVAVAAAGDQVVVETTLADLQSGDNLEGCGALDPIAPPKRTLIGGTPIAVAYDLYNHLLVQSREPPSVWVFGRGQIPLPGASRRDSGHEIFHGAPVAGVACASCHPEGREDGRVWQFDEIGKRRTQSVAGGVLETGALHWSGDLANFDALIGEVLVNRMQHEQPGPRHAAAFASWLDALPAPAPVPVPVTDAAAVDKGRALFNDAAVGCATCHGGPKLTTSQTADVGTGQKFKIPSLIGVAARAPFMHDGCAATLKDRFGACGGSDHGSTASLTAEQVSDLVAYMESL
jgi:YVTN family beta-propeller protein